METKEYWVEYNFDAYGRPRNLKIFRDVDYDLALAFCRDQDDAVIVTVEKYNY